MDQTTFLSMPCPRCDGHNYYPFDYGSGILCAECKYFVLDDEIEKFSLLHPELEDLK
jgi:hypothetical protein